MSNTSGLPQPPKVGGETRGLFGERFGLAQRYFELLAEHGEERGLIGPRELPRLWDRHIINSALLARALPSDGNLVDVGSGAGLPGIVIAIARPEMSVDLMEPMERRTDWLHEVVSKLGLENVTVKRGRAEEFHGAFEYDFVTARAVAPMDRLVRWCMPLVEPGGQLLAMKGQRAEVELEAALKPLRKFKAASWEVQELPGVDGGESTRVVKVIKKR